VEAAVPSTPTLGWEALARHGADLTPRPRLPLPHASARPESAACGERPDADQVDAFEILGGLLALWALTLAFLGITRENFPSTKGAERAVILISLTLVLCAISSAVLTAAAERKHEQEKERESGEHALVLPR
jgi:hypothetical protein